MAAPQMNEGQILAWIGQLTEEKDSLRAGHRGRPLSTVATQRLRDVEMALDLSWDLVRQRRARRAAGQDWSDLSARASELLKTYRR
ncbi:MAG TPA: DUF2630 family protein [Acidimicrobiales bacterium]|nr:DUF2630 family protein [Acidimicrobiales bacterium]